MRVSVVGAGLAGTECALQLAHRGYDVDLYEMRPKMQTPVHKTGDFAELVCSNSFGSEGEISGPGQLKFEAQLLNSFVLRAAKEYQVPAGQALAVDRERFAQRLTRLVQDQPRIQIHHQVIEKLSDIPRPAVIATGPLTHPLLAADLQTFLGSDFLYFFDAIAPIVDADTINMEIAWKADRYDKGTADYINCPMNKEEYEGFISAIQGAQKIEPKDFEKTNFFEGCMPIEVMVDRGVETPRFGPMKPVGLKNPKTGKDPWAVVQLRQDNREATAYNIVGFQTRMTYSEQIRVFRMIPGLENAEFLKLGSIHRNLYINSPVSLNPDLSSKKDPQLYFAGQMIGVEGYFESTCSGLAVAHFIDQKFKGLPLTQFPRETALGSILNAVTDPERATHFQPTNINFGLFPQIQERNKKLKKEKQIQKAKLAMESWINAPLA